MFDYHWRVLFKNGEILNQFVGDRETPFKLVMEKKDEIKELAIVSVKDSSLVYSVDMESGDFNLNGVKIISGVNISNFKETLSPIFFRRCSKTLLNPLVGDRILGYIIGWKCLDEAGKGIMQQFMITPDNQIVLLYK